MGNFKEDIAKIRAFVFDVDGVFTDGGIMPMPDGDFIRKYNAKDGYAVVRALRAGYIVAVITGGMGKTLELRFKALGVTRFCPGCTDKLSVLKEFMKEHSFGAEEVLFMGDDIPDLEAMREAGMPVCPADAAVEVIEASRYVSQFGGGQGCVRDIVEQVLRARGEWPGDKENCAWSVPSV